MTSIRPLLPEDEPAWRRLWRPISNSTRPSSRRRSTPTSFARLIDPNVADYQGLVALRDGEPVGFVHYIFHRHGWQIEDVCYLQDLYVAPQARGLGAGRALIEAVYAAADAAGAPNVYWMTQEFNATARRLYDQVATVTPFIKYRR